MMNEIILKAKECGSAEELFALARENEIKMTREEAELLYAELNNDGELSDDELSSASGGGCSSGGKSEIGDRFHLDAGYRCPACGHEYAIVADKRSEPLHGGNIDWYYFECEACKHVFQMRSWCGTVLN